jgi:hypothetical protein
VSPSSDSERNRRFAADEARRVLRISELSTDVLFALAAEVLGRERADRCLLLARRARLSRRSSATSAVASLIAGTRALGLEWWSRAPRDQPADGRRAQRESPDALLATGAGDGEAPLTDLASWMSDDAADAEWGRPIDYVDLNDPRGHDRVTLPAHAKPGDRVVASFDPGGRVWVDVVERGQPPRIGSCLAEHDYHPVAEVAWAWGIATGVEALRLPGESAGELSDPFLTTVDADAARELRAWAASHGATAKELGARWETKEDLWSARRRLDPYRRPGPWYSFERALAAAVDDDAAALAEALAQLHRGW